MSAIHWLIPVDLFSKKKLCFTKMFKINSFFHSSPISKALCFIDFLCPPLILGYKNFCLSFIIQEAVFRFDQIQGLAEGEDGDGKL